MHGLQVKNNANISQIDQNYSNYVLHSSGTLYGNWMQPTIGLTLPNKDALVFIDLFEELIPDNSGISSNFYYTKDIDPLHWNIVCSFKTTYYIYVPLSSKPTTDYAYGYGLNVFKADGTLAFSSNTKTLKITQVFPFTTGTDFWVEKPSPTVAGRKVLVGLNCANRYGGWDYWDEFSSSGGVDYAYLDQAKEVGTNKLFVRIPPEYDGAYMSAYRVHTTRYLFFAEI